ncbi:DUF4169 family protein [Maritalea sp. S77]|uniref:DUF4169 family protein n=1 Tax=Maritalea sp. S77 TaxID=3415125 RepID=UPI003C7AE1E3
MAEVVNLRQARKNKKRAEKEELAAANRHKHGQTKSVKKLHEARDALTQKKLDQQKIDKDK